MGGSQNMKHVDTSEASNQTWPLLVFLAPRNTKRPNVAVCSQKSNLFSPITVRLTLPPPPPAPPLLLFPPLSHWSGCYWSEPRSYARDEKGGAKCEPIRSCEREGTGMRTNQRWGRGREREYVIGELMRKKWQIVGFFYSTVKSIKTHLSTSFHKIHGHCCIVGVLTQISCIVHGL